MVFNDQLVGKQSEQKNFFVYFIFNKFFQIYTLYTTKNKN